jgi:cytidine deaminase
LKHPDEAKIFREVYGAGFYLIAAYAPHSARRDHLARGIAKSRNEYPIDRHYERAEQLIARDEQEFGLRHGQNVSDTFHRADVFFDTSDREELQRSIRRFVELTFGNTFHTPTKKEFAMFLATAAALRSAEMGRQVGAAISTDAGDIIAVGTNEVPKAGGGLYWSDDKPDRREFVEGFDSNDQHKRNLVADTLRSLQTAGWLNMERSTQPIQQLVEESMKPDVLGSDAQFRGLIEFGRAVHAEMAALVDAARRGVGISGASLFITTFPCHLCARHIVAAGIDRVFFIEPYAKSLTAELYPDSIAVESPQAGVKQVVFEPFVGVAPRQYMSLFTALDRKRSDGTVIQFVPAGAIPRFSGNPKMYLEQEDEKVTVLGTLMTKQGNLFQ